jgi:hypothetical protein
MKGTLIGSALLTVALLPSGLKGQNAPAAEGQAQPQPCSSAAATPKKTGGFKWHLPPVLQKPIQDVRVKVEKTAGVDTPDPNKTLVDVQKPKAPAPCSAPAAPAATGTAKQ